MVFVPSYLDYVRLRSFLRAEEFEFEGLSEYASGSEVARGRSRFAAGKVRLALYTERAHFYHRRNTKGVKVGFTFLSFTSLACTLDSDPLDNFERLSPPKNLHLLRLLTSGGLLLAWRT